jgi:hypothetical protein
MKPMLTAILAIVALGCASVQSHGDYDPGYDFAGLQTWDWMPEPGETRGVTGQRNPLIERRIQDAVTRELSAKGYRHAPGESVDFRVAYHASAEEKIDVSTTYDRYGYRWRTPVVYTDVREYTEGTIIVDVVDGTRDELVWRGTAVGVVRGGDPEDITDRINNAINDVLKDFPPM